MAPKAYDASKKDDSSLEKKRSKQDDEDDEEWQEIKCFITSDNGKKTLSSTHFTSNQKRASRHLYWLLVNPVFNKEDISKNDIIRLAKKNWYIYISGKKRTRTGVLDYLRVASVSYAIPLAYSKFKKLCGDRPSFVILMNRGSRVTDRLMCLKHLSKRFPSLLIGNGLDGSFTKIHFSCKGQISALDVEKTIEEYTKDIKNKVQKLKISVAASSYNTSTLSKSMKMNRNRKFQAFMLDNDEQLEKMKIFCEKNKNIVAAGILYENRVCLIRFSVPTKIKTLTSAIREKTGITLKNKEVYRMTYVEARKFLKCHSIVKKVYWHGNILEKASAGALPSRAFIVTKKNKEFTQEQLLYLINNHKVKTMLLNDKKTKGAIWCFKVLPSKIFGNKQILHDIEFESISNIQFDKLRREECITSVKKAIDYKKSIKPFLQYPFRNKRDRYHYFLSNPDVIDEETAKGYVENGTMCSYIKTKFPYCNSIILKSEKHIKLADVPAGLIPIDIDSAKRCSNKKTFLRLKRQSGDSVTAVNTSKGRTWIIENLKFEGCSDLKHIDNLYFDSQLQAHVYESPTRITLDTVLSRLKPSSIGNTRLASDSEFIKSLLKVDFNLVPFHTRHEFACAMLKIEPELTVLFESPAEMEGMILSNSKINGTRSLHYYFYETMKVCPQIQRFFEMGSMTLTRIDHHQSKNIKNKIYQRYKKRVCWMFCLHGDSTELMERLPHPLLAFYILKDNRCVFRTSMPDELVVPHLKQVGLIENEQLCLKISWNGVLSLIKYGIVNTFNPLDLISKRKPRIN